MESRSLAVVIGSFALIGGVLAPSQGYGGAAVSGIQ